MVQHFEEGEFSELTPNVPGRPADSPKKTGWAKP